MTVDMCLVRQAGSQTVIKLPVEIDMGNADQVGSELLRLLDEGAATLVVDMTATVFCDSAGIRTLVHAQRRAAAVGAGLRVAVNSSAVRRVLELTGIDRVIDTYPDLDAAMADRADTGP